MPAPAGSLPPLSSTDTAPRSNRSAAAVFISVKSVGAGRLSSAPASGMLGVSTVAVGISRRLMAATASGPASTSPLAATMTGSMTRTVAPWASSAAATSLMTSSLGSMPVLTACVPMSPKTASICARTKSTGTECTRWTPRVFCAVRATTAVVPNTPRASHVLRSAWIPEEGREEANGSHAMSQHGGLTRHIPARGLAELRGMLAILALLLRTCAATRV
eukprot:scaffold4358_cov137-Isochrysis_galbana.AAC.7